MANPFSSYRCINAANIVKSNIRSNHTKEDVADLLAALVPLKNLSTSNIAEGSPLERHIARKLATKSGILDLLIYFGYVHNDANEYIYQSPETKHERERRQNGTEEFQKLYKDLERAEKGSLNGFEQFIRHANRYASSSNDSESDEEPPHNKQREVNRCNAETLGLIQSFKDSLVTKYDAPPPHSFIRRKLALLLFKQKNRNAQGISDDLINETIDQKVRSLKDKDRQPNVDRADSIYIECLIRSNFDEKEALQILRHDRPNLTRVPQQAVPQTSTKISIDSSVQSLKQQYRLLTQYNNGNNVAQRLSHRTDKWENAKHIIPTIQQLRQKIGAAKADEVSFSKLFRLLYSELSCTIGQQAAVKIEIFVSVLCESPLDSIAHLDMVTIKNILYSSDPSKMNDDFLTNAMNALSNECPICSDSFPRSQMESMFLCDHMCCLECLKNYYRANIDQIRDLKSLSILTCFMERHEITNDTDMNFFTWLEAKLNQWFPDEPDLLRKYHDKVFDATRGKQIKKCGSLTCTSYFFVDDNVNNACVHCPHCQFSQCNQCTLKWHPEHTEMECEEYMEWLKENDPDDPNVQILKYLNESGGIVCPNKDCQTPFQYKAGGCEHFTCPQCGTQFCRMCPALFYSPTKGQKCPQANCSQKALHAHCSPNCFREIRDGQTNTIIKLLTDRNINVTEELEKKPVSITKKCSVDGCEGKTSETSGDRLCEICYKYFLCSLIWINAVEPWEIYEDNNLQQILTKASIPIPAEATRQNLIELCKQNLNQSLGKPKKLTKPKL